MNYDHTFHAGSFTDVYKHIVLMGLFQHLKKKDSAFGYLDTHSGYPYYDLTSCQAQRSKEAQQGIVKLWRSQHKLSRAVRDYLTLIQQFNQSLQAKERYYPGSTVLATLLKRPQDTVIANELEQQPFAALKNFFRQESTVHCHNQTADHVLKSLLPLKEKRGLIFIDPPYEASNEFDWLLTAMIAAVKIWPQGIYAIWYPIKAMRRIQLFAARLAKAIDRPQMNFPCCPFPLDVGHRLAGSGMLLINPPWQIEQFIQPVIDELTTILR
jgi:23S rRNA (adenine2030-N6)-methyltransferase